MGLHRCLVCACVVTIASLAAGLKVVNLHGAGATFPSPVYKSWLTNYKASRRDYIDLNVSYAAVGSFAGQRMIMENYGGLAYAGSDSPLSEEDHHLNPDLHMFPVIAG